VTSPRLIALPAVAFTLLALLIAADAGPIPRLDAAISRLAHGSALSHPLWRAWMDMVTVTGGLAVIGPLAGLGCAILVALGHWREAVFAAVALVATIALRLVVVALIARPRPIEQLAPASNYSFPSGHSAASAAAALILIMACWPLLRRRASRIALAVVAGTWAVAVGVSRVALVVHWPSDVLGAWLFVLVTVPGAGLLLRRLLGPPRA
jgi:undecaprenyl-diphosphatase